MTFDDFRSTHRTFQTGGGNGNYISIGKVGKTGSDVNGSKDCAISRLKSLKFIGTSTQSGLPMSHSLALIRDWQTSADSGL
jgi:hypothetical protein